MEKIFTDIRKWTKRHMISKVELFTKMGNGIAINVKFLQKAPYLMFD